MRICFLSSMHPANDKRVHYKEAVTLARHGFDVVHVTPNAEASGMMDGVRIVRYAGRRGTKGRIAQLGTLYRLGAGVDADVYHCNEVDSWAVGVALKLLRGKRVIFDVHEINSSNFAERGFPKPVRPFVEAAVRGFYRLLLPFTDRLVLAKRSATNDFPPTRVPKLLVQNYAELAAGMSEPETNEAPAADRPFTAIHLGAINRDRGWPQLLDALALTRDTTIRLRVIGKFGDNSEDAFLARAAELGLAERVRFERWIPYEQVFAELRRCDVGLITFQPVLQNFIHALPHKMFDYMLADLPVIGPDCAVEVREIMRESDCGILVDSTSPASIAAALDRLAADPALCRRYGRNGRQAVLDRYNWEAEGRKLVALYHELRGGDVAVAQTAA